eukprot:scaffold237485_cov24-Tisochrysis_lutea.AAC.3
MSAALSAAPTSNLTHASTQPTVSRRDHNTTSPSASYRRSYRGGPPSSRGGARGSAKLSATR